jgi:hypothetical protein
MSWFTRYLSYNRRYFFYRILYYRSHSYPRSYPRYSRRLRNSDFSFYFVPRILMRLINSRCIRSSELRK